MKQNWERQKKTGKKNIRPMKVTLLKMRYQIQILWSLLNFDQKQTTEILTVVRSSHQRCSVTKVVLRNFTKFTGKHLYQRLFFNKVAGLSPASLLKKKLWHRCFPVNFAKFLRTGFLSNTSRRVLLSSNGNDEKKLLNIKQNG